MLMARFKVVSLLRNTGTRVYVSLLHFISRNSPVIDCYEVDCRDKGFSLERCFLNSINRLNN